MRLRIIACVTACLALVAGVTTPSAAEPAPRPLDLPSGAQILFSLQAERGTLTRVRGKRYVLTLAALPRRGVWFTDRPARDSGPLPLGDFFANWTELGFGSDPPNAELAVTDTRGRAKSATLELGRPRYDAKKRTVRFRARAIGSAKTMPLRFADAALFIDDVVTQACDTMGQLELYPAGVVPSAYTAADGRLIPSQSNLPLATLFATTRDQFGPGGTFAVPAVAPPDAQLSYVLCVNGLYPSDLGGGPCVVGEIGLFPANISSRGWLPADGRGLDFRRNENALLFARIAGLFGWDGTSVFNLPKIDSAPPGTRYMVCREGEYVESTCRVGQVKLFAWDFLRFDTGRRWLAIPGPIDGTYYGSCVSGEQPV